MRLFGPITRAVFFPVICLVASRDIPSAVAAESAPSQDKRSFTLARDESGAVVKAPDGSPIFRYVIRKPPDSKLTANSACFMHPIYTPAGQVATDLAPDDHPHHRGAFLGWYVMHGRQDADFWGWGKYAPTAGRIIENRALDLQSTGAEHGALALQNEWRAGDTVMIDEELHITAYQRDSVFVMDWVDRLTSREAITLDQSAFGGFCVRSRKDGEFKLFDPAGAVTLPDPNYLKPDTDWPAAAWYGFSLSPAGSKAVGIAVIDHPDNPPTRWHNNRAVHMVNPCITTGGAMVLKPNEPLVLRYRLVSYDGEPPRAVLDELAKEWRHTYRIRYQKVFKIEFDGKIDEPAWSQAAVEKHFFFPWKRVQAPPTEFRALCDDRFLYFSFRVKDPDIVLVDNFRDKLDALFEDRVEMFFSRDDGMKDYYCFEADAKGRALDYRASWPRHLDMDWKWDGLETKASPLPGGYVLEGRISLASFDALGFGRLGPGSKLRCGLYRAEFSHDRSGHPPAPSEHTQGRQPEGPAPIMDWISWVDPKTPSPDFHLPASLGWLQIEK